MPPRTAKPTEDVELDADDVWAELVSENSVPPLKVKGIVLEQPTAGRVEKWRLAQSIEEGERLLFDAQYEAVKQLFAEQPEYVWENFINRYLTHMFGTAGGDGLKG